MPTGTDEKGWWCPSLDDSGNGTTTLTDFGSGAKNGTLTSMDAATDWVTDTGSGGVRALDFDGLNDHVVIGNVSTATVFSLTFWIYGIGSPGGQIVNYPIGTLSGEGIGWGGSFGGVAGKLFAFGGGASTGNSTFTADTGAWHHVAALFNETTVSFYVDGVAKGSPTISANTSPSDMYLAARPAGAGAWHYNCRLDDIRVFERLISAGEITSLASQRGYQPASGNSFLNRRPMAGGLQSMSAGGFTR